MPTQLNSGHVQAAMQLIRAGRFSQAVATLNSLPHTRSIKDRRTRLLCESILADALQRTGENKLAAQIASRLLTSETLVPDVHARCNLVLGNVCRERGHIARSLEYFQAAAGAEQAEQELLCWARFRLLVSIAESEGVHIALAHLDNLRRSLAKLGDPRPFAALHLWLAETQSVRGGLRSAKHHLSTAEALLGQVDDAWLQGYLAINSSGVNYYCADIVEARRWAELAITYSQLSGHRGARRAAHANMGQIEFAAGHLDQAEGHFGTALKSCEAGSPHELSVLDSIARIKLQIGDLKGCKSILRTIDDLIASFGHSRPQHYETWALQTRIQLLLKEGGTADAACLSQTLKPNEEETPQSRTTTTSHLLAIESLMADGNFDTAASSFSAIVSDQVQLPPDLLAEKERLVGNMIAVCLASELAKAQLERAGRMFAAIGHSIGRNAVEADIALLAQGSTGSARAIASLQSLLRISALLDTRTQPELFGREAASFLEELGCAENLTLTGKERSAVPWDPGLPADTVASLSKPWSIELDRVGQGTHRLDFVPRQEAISTIGALYFRKVINQVLAFNDSTSALDDRDLLWLDDDLLSTKGVVFASEPMLSILRTVRKVAPTDVSVLITGETGTGKEVIARRIHEQSARATMPFLALNCSAVPRDLLESQLFGYRRGAFSGATESFQGVIRAASEGTLFLDEVGEIPIDMQAKLLRFLELGEVPTIGEAQPRKVNVRLVFATNHNLEEAVREGRFREDLYYRLNVVPIRIPPLRDRREEIPLLVSLFSQRCAREFSKAPIRFSGAAMELLILYSWPGNVRQLGNEVRRLAALIESETAVTPEHLSKEMTRPLPNVQLRMDSNDLHLPVRLDQPLAQATAYLEREMIERALSSAQGRVAPAAASLGLSRKGLYLKRRRLGMAGAER